MSEQDVQQWAGRNKPGMPLFHGPPEIREAFIRFKGIDWTASYIDPANWLPASKAIVARTHIAQRRIMEQASGICAMLKVRVMPPPEQHARMAAE
jgi:hypothetical protein